jgi:multicomponent Na+:H+ antiporter subunit D
MRRILAYSIVNQVGFMVCGAGIGTDLAVNGAAAHAFAHLIYKGLLLMSAGSVLVVTGKRLCTDLGGLWRSLPVTAACAIVGAMSISAFPLTSGFVTKSLISSAAGREHLSITWFVLTAASAGVFLHAGIKFPWFVFFHRDQGLRPREPAWNLRAAMLLASALCLLPGFLPGPLHALLPHPVDEAIYTGAHVVSQLQLLLFGGLAFFVLLPMLERERTITLDWDWTWRRLGSRLAQAAERIGARLLPAREAAAGAIARRLVPGDAIPRRVMSWPLWVSVLLLSVLFGSLLGWISFA